jgi:putative ABC transport system permease protein
VLATIDNAGTRSITIAARPGYELEAALLDRVLTLSDIEWVGASRFIADVRNSSLAGSAAVSVQAFWTTSWEKAGLPVPALHTKEQGYASSAVLQRLGIADGVGRVQTDDEREFVVAGPVELPEHLSSLGSGILVNATPDIRRDGFEKIHILVRASENVELVAAAITRFLQPETLSRVTVSTSAKLARVQGAVKGELANSSRVLSLVIAIVMAVLSSGILVLSVLQRRRDFGRRRALGATRGLIATLILVQTAALATIGAVIGGASSLAVLLITQAPIPPADYLTAVGLLAVWSAVLAALLPGYVASRRDPAVELRVP